MRSTKSPAAQSPAAQSPVAKTSVAKTSVAKTPAAAFFVDNPRYSPVRCLGEGAQGTVHLVRDKHLDGRLIALKLLRPQADREWHQAFRNEFETLAGLQHPRLASVHDFGATGDGRVYFTRDYVEGVDLRRAASEQKLWKVIDLLVEVCRALKPLHGRGLLHGDLKPGNIICSDTGVASLIDFSFVRPSGHDARRRGTVQFMAPEIIEGRPADARTDLYALGATIYDVVCGAPPFDGSVSEIIKGHLGTDRPAFRPRQALMATRGGPDIVQGLHAIVSRLVARHPQDRFPDVHEVEAALTALGPSQVSPDPLPNYPVINESVGRYREMSRVRESVEQRLWPGSQRGGSPDETALKVIVGELGTGKSTVLRTIKWWAQLRDAVVVESRCSGAGGFLGPIADLVTQTACYFPAHDRTQIALGTHLAERLSDPKTAGSDVNGLTRETVELFKQIAKRKRLIVAIDDVEQAREEVLQVLRGVVGAVSPEDQIVVLATVESSFPWVERLGRGESVTLPVLSAEQIEPLVREFLGRADGRVVERVKDHTGGNPLFVLTLLRDLAASGEGAERLERLGAPKQLEMYWRDRLKSLRPEARSVLVAAAVLARPARRDELLVAWGGPREKIDSCIAELETQGWLRHGPKGWHVTTCPLADQILSSTGADELAKYHNRAIDVEPEEDLKLIHMALGGDAEIAVEKGRQVAISLEHMGALGACRDLLTVLERVAEHPDYKTEIYLHMGRVCLNQGDYDVAREYLSPLTQSENVKVRRSSLLLFGRLCSALGKLDEATACLDEVLTIAGDRSDEARALFERANIEYKNGDLSACFSSGEAGLLRAPMEDPVRVDLMGILALAATRDGRHQEALERAHEAAEEARATGDRRSLARAIEIHSWVRQHSGDVTGAIEELEKAVDLNREFGDYPRLMRDQQVLGDLKYWREDWREALGHYEEAMRLASAVANPKQHLQARMVFGMQLAKLGRFANAELVLRRAEQESDALGQEELRLVARIYQADLLASNGQIDRALDQYYEDARRGLERCGYSAYLADLELEMASWYLWRRGSEDLRLAGELIESAAERKREYEGRHFAERLQLQQGSLKIARGDFEQGRLLLDDLTQRMDEKGLGDIAWQAHLAVAKGYIERGTAFLARGRLRQAEAVLERLSEGFSPEHHRAFWQDIRRAEVRGQLAELQSEGEFDSSAYIEEHKRTLDPEARYLYRVLDFNKRISAEHDISRLLDAILAAAVELTGAEHGMLLMATEGGGNLSLRAESGPPIGTESTAEQHRHFSKSIAESVHLDGEPVFTIDAMGDDRFNEFASIHELQLRSVACLPVRHRGQGLGVLYLENRLRRGRFGAADLRVLSAFADQMAIAIAQARLLEEARKKEAELVRARKAMEEAFQRQSLDLSQKDANLKLARERLDRARQQLEGVGDYYGIVGVAPSMRKVFALVERVKDLDVPVVFVGESGTGKDLFARVLHDQSLRQNGPFLALNCGGVPDTLVESTLFGHVKGAFSGASADKKGILEAVHGGTLYLDEIGDMSPRMQVDFLRVLQEESFVPLGSSETISVDFRLVVSSKIPLDDLVKQGRLRKDLLYRLQVVTIDLPPLRDREEDILTLCQRLLDRTSAQMGMVRRSLTSEALRAIAAYQWPGNVRELEQAIRRAIIIGEGFGPIGSAELFDKHRLSTVATKPGARPALGSPEHGLGTSPKNATSEEQLILAVLERCQWNRSKAAKELEIPRRTFYRKLDKMGLLKKKARQH